MYCERYKIEGTINLDLNPSFNYDETYPNFQEDLNKFKSHLKELVNNKEYDDLKVRFNYIDSKQKALKVFMNSFYGESGNKISPLFVIQIAGGITSSGKRQIKCAKELVEEIRCDVKYGDTDSIYLSIPEKHFIELDKKYYSLNLLSN